MHAIGKIILSWRKSINYPRRNTTAPRKRRANQHAVTTGVPTTPRKMECASGTAQRLLVKYVVSTAAPTKPRGEVYATHTEQPPLKRNAATKVVPTKPSSVEFASRTVQSSKGAA